MTNFDTSKDSQEQFNEKSDVVHLYILKIKIDVFFQISFSTIGISHHTLCLPFKQYQHLARCIHNA